jgi:hypothetical protein
MDIILWTFRFVVLMPTIKCIKAGSPILGGFIGSVIINIIYKKFKSYKYILIVAQVQIIGYFPVSYLFLRYTDIYIIIIAGTVNINKNIFSI